MKYLILLLVLVVSCVSSKSPDKKKKSAVSPVTRTGTPPPPVKFDSRGCRLDKLGLDDQLGAPKTIEDAVDLINQLPKPLTIPCFLQALERPLKINATSSILSVQQAVGPENPRLFILMDKLILSIAPAGNGKMLLEFSYMYNPKESLKGELKFPIDREVSYTAPYTRINGDGQTSCSACHMGERKDSNINFTDAFVSIALKPDPTTHIPLGEVYQQYVTCVTSGDDSYRCRMMLSLFENGSLMEGRFPASTPTYFESFSL